MNKYRGKGDMDTQYSIAHDTTLDYELIEMYNLIRSIDSEIAELDERKMKKLLPRNMRRLKEVAERKKERFRIIEREKLYRINDYGEMMFCAETARLQNEERAINTRRAAMTKDILEKWQVHS